MDSLIKEILIRMVFNGAVNKRNIIVSKIFYFANECVESAVEGNFVDFKLSHDALCETLVLVDESQEVKEFVQKLLGGYKWLFVGGFCADMEMWATYEILDNEAVEELYFNIDKFLLPNE